MIQMASMSVMRQQCVSVHKLREKCTSKSSKLFGPKLHRCIGEYATDQGAV
jgi:hypothetical protein